MPTPLFRSKQNRQILKRRCRSQGSAFEWLFGANAAAILYHSLSNTCVAVANGIVKVAHGLDTVRDCMFDVYSERRFHFFEQIDGTPLRGKVEGIYSWILRNTVVSYNLYQHGLRFSMFDTAFSCHLVAIRLSKR